jgi:hypothetical protein
MKKSYSDKCLSCEKFTGHISGHCISCRKEKGMKVRLMGRKK